MELEKKIAEIVGKNSEVKAEVGPETNIRQDLDIDSFGVIMIINAIEDAFDVAIEETDFRELNTISDIARLLETKYLQGTPNEQ